MKNVLVIGAHPDDIEIGCIGTVLKLKNEGKKIIYLVMTNGGNWEKKLMWIECMKQKMQYMIQILIK